MNRLLTQTVKPNESEKPQGANSAPVLAAFTFIVLIGGAALWWQLTTSVPGAGTERHLHNVVSTPPSRLPIEPANANDRAPQATQTFGTEDTTQSTLTATATPDTPAPAQTPTRITR
ncbi:hypothetical protein [Roseateles koreensis]|uniref:Uncharacterized protein n=1 Tax=Roseateles koreensis TaxID=2987526 RepID=A0ABT5KPR8_9BURK|nr:hypothetical protein [Roseateles koreensis]MDC8783772.1 hypothetical protein [Roseateles koreensis]